MNNFKKDGFRKGGSGFGGKQGFGGAKRFGGSDRGGKRESFSGNRSSEDKELFKATCSACHTSCEVPFRPSGEKPVYCRECYRDNSQSDTRTRERSGGRGDVRHESRSFRDERPGYREAAPAPAPRDTGIEDVKRQLAILEGKVDSIIAFMSSQILVNAEKRGEKEVVTQPEPDAPKKARKTTSAPKKAAAKKKSAPKKAS